VTGLAAATYVVNQAIDGVAVRHVAQAYVASPEAQRPNALLVADAVRHLEIGSTSAFQALLGSALLLTAVALRRASAPLAGLSAIVGVGWLVLAADVAENGFANPGPTGLAALGLVSWAVASTVVAASSLRSSAGLGRTVSRS
jgi:hypothetical protein